MSLWYDIKHKSYATDYKNSWIRSYVEKLVEALKTSVDSKFTSHFNGTLGRHVADDIDCDDGTTVQSALENEAAARSSSINELREDTNTLAAAIRSEMNAADTNIRSAIADEVTNRTNADTQLQSSIDSEASARAAALALKVDKESGKSLSSNDYTDADKTKLSGIQAGAQVNAVISVCGKVGAVSLSKSDVGLSNVNNTSDADKPISTAVQTALNSKANNSALDLKANKSDVLTKTNTTSFTPSSDYHPATKKYVDDSVSSAGGGDMLKNVYDTTNNGVVDNSEKLGGQLPSYYATAEFANTRAVTSHASGATTYGCATPTLYGHVKTIDNLTTTSTTGNALSANQGRILNEKILALQTPPSLAAPSASGTAIGASGWTGTGFFCTSANTKYAVTHKPYVNGAATASSINGFNRYCIKFATVSNEYKNWTPYFEFNGNKYEFFYSPSRGLYEALIPATALSPAQVLEYVKWKKHAPTILNYGKVRGLGYFEVKNSEGSITTQNAWVAPETILRDTSGMPDNDDWNKLLQYTTASLWDSDLYALDTTSLSLIFLLADVNADGKINNSDWLTLQGYTHGTPLALDTIDNFS